MEGGNNFALPFAALINSLVQDNVKWYNFHIAVSQHMQQQNALVIYRSRVLRRRKSRPVYWEFPRPESSWLNFTLCDEAIPESEFKCRLRISKDTFRMLLNVCQVNIVRKNTKFRASLPPDKVLAIGLYRLALGSSTRVCADVFNVGQTTVMEAF